MLSASWSSRRSAHPMASACVFAVFRSGRDNFRVANSYWLTNETSYLFPSTIMTSQCHLDRITCGRFANITDFGSPNSHWVLAVALRCLRYITTYRYPLSWTTNHAEQSLRTFDSLFLNNSLTIKMPIARNQVTTRIHIIARKPQSSNWLRSISFPLTSSYRTSSIEGQRNLAH